VLSITFLKQKSNPTYWIDFSQHIEMGLTVGKTVFSILENRNIFIYRVLWFFFIYFVNYVYG